MLSLSLIMTAIRPIGICWVLCSILATTTLIAADPAPMPDPVVEPRIEVFKSERVLLFYSGQTLLRRYPVGLGFEPVKDKVQQGDGATPEGSYRVCIKNPWSRFYLSLGLDYPNREDAERGRQSRLISQPEQAAVVTAVDNGRCPPWNTRLGGEIFIHGRGSGSDWTLGCVALDDADMKELFDAIPLGTPVIIHP